MAATTIVVTRRGGTIPNPPAARAHPHAVITSAVGGKLSLPYAPTGATITGLEDVWSLLDRPGRQPLNRRDGDGIPVLSFETLLAYPDHQQSVEDLIAKVRAIAYAGATITIGGLSPGERGPWRVTASPITITQRQHGTNHATRATVAWTFTAAVDADVKVGPVSGGHKAKPKPKKKAPKKPATRYYRIKKGETLWELASRYYGDPYKWKVLAKASGIRNVRTIPIGRKITVPPK